MISPEPDSSPPMMLQCTGSGGDESQVGPNDFVGIPSRGLDIGRARWVPRRERPTAAREGLEWTTSEAVEARAQSSSSYDGVCTPQSRHSAPRA